MTWDNICGGMTSKEETLDSYNNIAPPDDVRNCYQKYNKDTRKFCCGEKAPTEDFTLNPLGGRSSDCVATSGGGYCKPNKYTKDKYPLGWIYEGRDTKNETIGVPVELTHDNLKYYSNPSTDASRVGNPYQWITDDSLKKMVKSRNLDVDISDKEEKEESKDTPKDSSDLYTIHIVFIVLLSIVLGFIIIYGLHLIIRKYNLDIKIMHKIKKLRYMKIKH